MRLATWNINSVRLRMPLVAQLVKEYPLDVLCLQETKVRDELFPEEELKALGFEYLAYSGEKGYNGVAILSRIPLSDVQTEKFAGREDTRHIAVTLPDGTRLHNVYIPAGGDIPDVEQNPSFDFKLRFVDELSGWLADSHAKDDKVIVVGDYNIAPLENDVWSHKQLLKIVSHTPIEVEKMKGLQQSLAFTDAVRHFVPESEKIYSWWSYRARDWDAADKGRKLDHIWLTAPLVSQLKQASILRHVRGWERPSDHVPVVVELAV